MKQILIDFLTQYNNPYPLSDNDLNFINQFIKIQNLNIPDANKRESSNLKATLIAFVKEVYLWEQGFMPPYIKNEAEKLMKTFYGL